MKKILFPVISLGIIFVSTAVNAASINMDLHYVKHIQQAREEYDQIQVKLKKAVMAINKKGTEAFKEIKDYNKNDKDGEGIFVIDPQTGQLLVSPPKSAIGKDALLSSEINGKAVAKEAIRKAYTELYGSTWESWVNVVGEVYNTYLTQLAITLDGKLYVVAIGKTNIVLQRLFVTKIVDDACKTIKEIGTEKAFKIFDKPDSMYKFNNTYIFVYVIKSPNDMTCLYNPNYAASVGKNVINVKEGDKEIFKEIVQLLSKVKNGWVRSTTLIPGTTESAAKDIYVKAINVNGKKIVVGSGVYLDN